MTNEARRFVQRVMRAAAKRGYDPRNSWDTQRTVSERLARLTKPR